MKNEKIKGIVRHVITLIGGVLVAFGVVGEDVVGEGSSVIEALVGSVLAAYGFVTSLINKKKTEDKITEALKTPVPE